MNKQEYLRRIQQVIEVGPFDATWESLSSHRMPDWYEKSKLGIFVHWGVYSVPGFGNEW